ncbi:MAG TPA: hypothetical protein VJS13_05295 [Pyrinomonadaceae bacterium]|nr:hypothetical protein [Pyrinomonadaceae bacterium]
MSIELQIQAAVLGNIAANAIEARLRTTCFPSVAEVFLDHADVSGTVEVLAGLATIRLRVPVDIFVVRRTDLLATPNAIPPGASTAAGTVTLLLDLSVSGTVLSLQCVDVDLGGLGQALGPAAADAKTAIVGAIGAAVTSDLKPALTQLGMPNPGFSRIELTAGVVAIRFEPAGAPQVRLFPGQDWGIFLDGPAVEQLAKSKVPKALGERLTSFVLNASWRPSGTLPHVDMSFSGKAQVPDPFAGDVSGTFACDFVLTGPATRTLRSTVHWSMAVDLGDASPAFIDKAVREMLESAVFLSVIKSGGIPAGNHTFAFESGLPEVAFGGARLNYASMLASPAGMTIGGPVRWPILPSRDTVKFSVTNFGLPSRLEFCSQLAKTGSGAPDRTATLKSLTTTGRVWLDDGGAFCEFEIISPADWLKTYVHPPDAGDVGESHDLRIVIPSNVARGIRKNVQLIVRTARGVRLIDFGIPPAPELDISGNVTNAQITYIDDCLYLPVGPEDPFGINWGDPRDLLINPVDWLSYLDALQGLDVQVINLSGLQQGELIQFRSRDHSIDVTADINGRAVVPVLLPVTDQAAPAMLTRANRQSIAGHVSVDSVVLQRQASLPAGLRSSLSSDLDGTARLTTEFEDRIEIHGLDDSGSPMLLENHQLSTANREFSQADYSSTASHYGCDSLPGLTAVHTLPGFEDAGVAIAEMSDGSRLVLDTNDEGMRVAGTFSGPIGSLEINGDWGLLTGQKRATIYRVLRERPASLPTLRRRESQ